jgi:GNAT superfamily N-acetyltransferase
MQFGDYQIIHYTTDYHDALLELLSLLWGADRQGNAAYFNWKYAQNPYADRHWIYLALYKGQLVGVRGNLAMRWQAGDPVQSVDCLCDADAVVHPDHRRKGLLQAMTRVNLQDLESTPYRYIVSLSANAKSGASNLKLRWQRLGPIQPTHRLRPQPVVSEGRLKTLVRKIPLMRGAYKRLRDVFRPQASATPQLRETMSSFDKFDERWHRSSGESSEVSIGVTVRPRQMTDLISRLPTNPRMRHVRDSDYFAWRYRNPRSIYRFLFLGKAPLKGYLVLQTPARPGMRTVTIVDWEAQDMAVRSELLKTAIQLGDFEILSTWGISLGASAVNLLHQSGFVFQEEIQEQEDYQPEVLLKATFGELQDSVWHFGGLDLLDLRNWDFRPIYSDTY